MDLPALIETLVKAYGPQAVSYAILLWIIFVLAKKYDAVMQARIKEGVETALTMDRNTQALNALSELIKDRKS